MDNDLMFVIAFVTLCMSIPSLFSAYAESRVPRVAAILVLVGGVLLVVSLSRKPGGILLGEVPEIFARVIARYIN